MHNQNILKAIDDINRTCQDPERHQKELEKLMEKYGTAQEIVKTLPNGIKLFRILDQDGLTIGEYHGLEPVKQWGGTREGSGRPATGRKKRNFYITEEEEVILRKHLEELRTSQK